MKTQLSQRGLKAMENKTALVENIIDDLKFNMYDSYDYIFDLCREALMKRTQAELKEINAKQIIIMKTQFTTGEWHTQENDFGMFRICTDNNKVICDLTESTEPYDKNRGNAQLIAAAPDLFFACESILANLETNKKFGTTMTDLEINSAINILTNAIKKVTE